MDLPLHVALQQSSHYTDSAYTPQDIKILIDPLQTAILWANQDGNTPLHLALSNISIHATLEFIDILRLLVDPNGDVLGMTNKDGMTPLEMLPSPLHLVHGSNAKIVHIIQDFLNTFPVMMQI
jgi:ankyrin repeat protein